MKSVSGFTALGEFRDREIEKHYTAFDTRRSMVLLRVTILLGGGMFAAYIFVDILYGIRNEMMLTFLWYRLIPLLFCIPFFFFADRIRNRMVLNLVTTFIELFTFVCYMVILYIYADPKFTMESMSVVIFVLLVFCIPNQILYNLFTCIFYFITYFVFTQRVPNHSGVFSWYQFFGVLFSIVFAFYVFQQLNIAKRVNYMNESQLQRLAETDKMTGIKNRSAFDLLIHNSCVNADALTETFSVILFDIDHFKEINDTYGHAVGDEVLKKIAQIAAKNIRVSDAIARWGGEEFVVVLPQAGAHTAYDLSERIRKDIMDHVFPESLQVTASFGVAEYRAGDTPESLLRRVDKLMYTAKKLGRNQTAAGGGIS